MKNPDRRRSGFIQIFVDLALKAQWPTLRQIVR